ncbi:MAG: type II toxin-antitoxin system VapC family toxin [Parvularculaceae bacterium]
MLYFLDTSALVKLYVQEPGTARLRDLVRSEEEHRFAVLSISAVEARSGIRRRQREGDIDPNSADQILAALQRDMEEKFVRQSVNDAVIETASELVDRYPLRAYDAMQLGGCVMLGSSDVGAVTFLCSDQRLIDAARSEGISVLDPAA